MCRPVHCSLHKAGLMICRRTRVNQLVVAEKKNLEEVEALARNGIFAGAVIAGVSGLAIAWINFRGR